MFAEIPQFGAIQRLGKLVKEHSNGKKVYEYFGEKFLIIPSKGEGQMPTVKIYQK